MNVDVCDRRLNFICEKGSSRKLFALFRSHFSSPLVVDRCSSLNDICGQHGRCINTDDGQFRCQCHFPFDGNRCRSSKTKSMELI